MTTALSHRFLAWAALIAGLVVAPTALTQPSLDDLTSATLGREDTTAEPLTLEELVERTQELIPAIEQELASTRSLLAGERGSNRPLGIAELEDTVDQFRQLRFLREQLVSEYEQSIELAESLRQANEDLAAARAGRPPRLPPYDFDTIEALTDDRYAFRSLRDGANADASRMRTALEREERRSRERTADRRAVRDRLADADGRDDRARHARQQELAPVRERVAQATVELRRAQLNQAIASGELAEVLLAVTEESLAQIQPRVRFTRRDFDQRLAQIAQLQDDLSETFAAIRRASEAVQDRLAEREAENPEPSDAREAADEIDRELLLVLSERSEVIAERRRRSAVLRDAWSDRFAIERNEYSARELEELREDIRSIQGGLDVDEEALTDVARRARSRLVTLEAAEASIAPQNLPLADQRQEEYRQLALDIDGALQGIEVIRRVFSQLGDVASERGGVSWGDKVVIAWSYVARIWSFGLVELDNDTSLTVGKLVMGLLLLSLAFSLSTWRSAFLSIRVLPRFGLNPHAASAVKSIFFYVFLLTFALSALRIIEIPLTVFAVLGGAVAIGIGFGSQTLANNFMSGLILLSERPVRVGDFIDVNGVVGTVQQIGARSTRIMTPANIEMILPNSTLLENNLVNWTLRDKVVWLSVDVGLAYGSPTRDASKLILKAAEEHGRVLKSPPPRVIFDSFGDNSLNFRLFFAINMNQPGDRLGIPSDLRYRIDNLLRDADITIAFPQRDVHLDTPEPLQIELKRSMPTAEQPAVQAAPSDAEA